MSCIFPIFGVIPKFSFRLQFMRWRFRSTGVSWHRPVQTCAFSCGTWPTGISCLSCARTQPPFTVLLSVGMAISWHQVLNAFFAKFNPKKKKDRATRSVRTIYSRSTKRPTNRQNKKNLQLRIFSLTSIIFTQNSTLQIQGSLDCSVKLWDFTKLSEEVSLEDVNVSHNPDIRTNTDAYLLRSYATKNTPLLHLLFSRRNVLLSVGTYDAAN